MEGAHAAKSIVRDSPRMHRVGSIAREGSPIGGGFLRSRITASVADEHDLRADVTRALISLVPTQQLSLFESQLSLASGVLKPLIALVFLN